MSGRVRILVVDDEKGVRNVLATILEKEGYVVDTAQNGKEAIEKSNANFYNLVLIDIRLPDMEGTELLTEMKETTPKIVKIIITGYPSLENAIEATNKGADAYILKPLEMERVVHTIKEHLRKQREAREYSEKRMVEFIETRARQLEAVPPK